MGLIPDTAFTVRKPAWWDYEAKFDLDYYPGREEAMQLAGHAFDIKLSPVARAKRNEDGTASWKPVDGFKAHVRSDNGVELTIKPDSFEPIPNSLAYDVAEWVLEDQRFKFMCGISMDEGRQNALTLLLDEPWQLKGDRAQIWPLVALSWAHDGTGALKLRRTTIRNECQNTVSASEVEAAKANLDYTFRHTKNVKERIKEAREAISGVGPAFDVFKKAMEELAAIQVTPEQRDLYVSTIIGDRDGVVSKSATVSDRVKNNLETERAKINALFLGSTIPEAHQLTGYGLHLAGVEYFDHLRAYRSKDSYVKRTLLSDNPAKANLTRTIRELVAA